MKKKLCEACCTLMAIASLASVSRSQTMFDIEYGTPTATARLFADFKFKTASAAIKYIEKAVAAAEATTPAVHHQDPGDTEWLMGAYSVSFPAFQALQLTGKSALPAINAELSNPKVDAYVKAFLCGYVLNNIPSAQTIDILNRIIHDSSQSLNARSTAASALVQIDMPRADRLAEKIVENLSLPVDARIAIMQQFTLRGFDDVDWLDKIAEGKLYRKGQLVSSDEGTGIIWNAIRALGTSKNPCATDILIRLQEKNLGSGVIAMALHERDDSKSIPVLIKVLTWPTNSIGIAKAEAATALGKLKAKEAIYPMLRLLKFFNNGRDLWTQYIGAEEEADSLEQLAIHKCVIGTQVLSGIETYVWRKSKCPYTERKNEALNRAMVALKRDNSYIRTDDVDYLLAMRMGEALGEIGAPKALPLIRPLLDDPRLHGTDKNGLHRAVEKLERLQ
ncbi:MAG: HEAT repeat domain-containing protein [Elusimicrobiota bacterium]